MSWALECWGGMSRGQKAMVLAAASSAVVVVWGLAFYLDRKKKFEELVAACANSNYRTSITAGRDGERNQDADDIDDDEDFPAADDTAGRERFFKKEVRLGEQCMMQGEYQKSIEHISRAVVVCGKPECLLSFLQPLLPHDKYQVLVQEIPKAKERFLSRQRKAADIQANPDSPQIA
ncbi:unnamed protein product [Cyprideis torosa]|uniref:Uncharacterized protein n=1 Tax=Cyprideis torosa TaxID=163714 RepID=A0A7R8WEJ5_9CRUS|nr:unnamed protein product [Cyprideis torosa]CAG0892991.1 unnamed protein product [Cyprideis torosa]